MTERYLATTIGQLKRCGSANIIAIAKATNLSRQTVSRIKDDPAAAEAALATWEAA
jgi:hypothetical protein